MPTVLFVNPQSPIVTGPMNCFDTENPYSGLKLFIGSVPTNAETFKVDNLGGITVVS